MHKGFSLIELMMVVIVVALLAALVYPSYQQHRQKTQRIAAQAELTALAMQIQAYKIANSTLLTANAQPIALTDIGENYRLTLPRNETALYRVVLDQVSAHRWTLYAIPLTKTSQQDGGLALNHRGEKCRLKAQARCTPSPSSTW